jgi:hypothetical protein
MFLDKVLNRTIELPTNYGNELQISLPPVLSYKAIDFNDVPEYQPSVRLIYRLRKIEDTIFNRFYTYEFDGVEIR